MNTTIKRLAAQLQQAKTLDEYRKIERCIAATLQVMAYAKQS